MLRYIQAAKFSIIFLFCSFSWASPEIQTSGFLTTGATKTNSRIDLSGLDDNLNFDFLTKAGLDLAVKLNSSFSAKVQLVGRGAEKYNVAVNLAQIDYIFSDHLTVRFGKIRLPLWLLSDHLDVGTLYPWSRAPDLYLFSPVNSFLGASAIKTWDLSNDLSIQLEILGGGGPIESETEQGTLTGEFRDTFGVNFRLYKEDLQIRLAYGQGRIEADILIPTDVNGVRQSVVVPFDVWGLHFYSTSLIWKPNPWLVMAEVGEYRSDSDAFRSFISYYLTIGRSFFNDKVLLHQTTSVVDNTRSTLTDGRQRTYSVGVNYFFGLDVVAKFDYGLIEVFEDRGLFTSNPGKNVSIFDASLNVTF